MISDDFTKQLNEFQGLYNCLPDIILIEDGLLLKFVTKMQSLQSGLNGITNDIIYRLHSKLPVKGQVFGMKVSVDYVNKVGITMISLAQNKVLSVQPESISGDGGV